MNKIKPTYVTFEQAKWLKEKGFDIPCREGWYTAQVEPYKGQLFTDDTGSRHDIEKPEQWQVVEWLRVNHGIWISVDYSENVKWCAKIVKLPKTFKQELMKFNSPQEAYSAAFDYILNNNLI